jgi:NAD(P)-dependent dehydrogenase (short-subunit alcohol dehydrogenase family)
MKTALITGGSRGIGLGCATHLAAQGFAIAINGVRPADQVDDVLDEIRRAGAPEVLYCRGDVGTAEGRRAVLDALTFPALNVLVNNAGVAPLERLDLLDTSPESYQRVMRINLEGPFFLSQAIAKRMITDRQNDPAFDAAIINVNSISATVASTNRGEYCISKAGLAMVTQLFAARLGEYGIPVYEVRPGITKTDMTSGVTEKYDRLLEEGLCVTPRWGTPDDVGRAVTALANGQFPYSTGQAIHIDGGLTLPRL